MIAGASGYFPPGLHRPGLRALRGFHAPSKEELQAFADAVQPVCA